MSTFDVGGTKYEVSRLKVKDSLRGLKLIGKVFLPALGEAANAPEGQVGDAMTKVVDGLDSLPELLDLFSPVTKFLGPTGSMTDLAPFLEEQFGGRSDLCVEFLLRALSAEYGSFLARPDVSALLKKLQAKFASA